MLAGIRYTPAVTLCVRTCRPLSWHPLELRVPRVESGVAETLLLEPGMAGAAACPMATALRRCTRPGAWSAAALDVPDDVLEKDLLDELERLHPGARRGGGLRTGIAGSVGASAFRRGALPCHRETHAHRDRTSRRGAAIRVGGRLPDGSVVERCGSVGSTCRARALLTDLGAPATSGPLSDFSSSSRVSRSASDASSARFFELLDEGLAALPQGLLHALEGAGEQLAGQVAASLAQVHAPAIVSRAPDACETRSPVRRRTWRCMRVGTWARDSLSRASPSSTAANGCAAARSLHRAARDAVVASAPAAAA